MHKLKKCKARKGRNPNTGEEIKFKATKHPSLPPERLLRQL